MSKNIIMRPVYNRPEMLALSLEYEVAAREYYDYPDELTTLFIVEYGADEKTKDLVKSYSFPKKILQRPKKFGLSMNILEGFKVAFDLSEEYVIYIEDDILVHKTYFEYMDKLKSMVDKFSVLSAYHFDDGGDVHDVYQRNHYAALAPLISKKFFEEYVKPHAKKDYYGQRQRYINGLDAQYANNKDYKYSKSRAHNEQAGMINRLVDVAWIEEKLPVYMPKVNRQQHIGYFGKNRPGGSIPGKNYEERLANLRKIIQDPKAMFQLAGTKAYNDYKAMPEDKLKKWNGTLNVT